MSTATVILGKSGTGKSATLRNLDPSTVLLIQAVRKPLPFKSTGWVRKDPDDKTKPFNVLVTDSSASIVKACELTKKKIIVIDDFQYVLANELMRRSEERGFDKFSDIARHGWDVFQAIGGLADDVRVYVLSHSQEDDNGSVRLKTVGKMLDEKIVLEGLVTLVLRTEVSDGEYFLRTKNNGFDTVKTALGMFDVDRIPNDLAVLDKAICEYYEIKG